MRAKLLTVMALILLGGCRHKELCYDCVGYDDGDKLYVFVDWSEEPEAEVEGMRLYFYPTDGSAPTIENISGIGGLVYVTAGEYELIGVNNDTQTHLWRGESSISTLELYTRDASLVEDDLSLTSPAPPVDGEGVVLAPERLYKSGADSVVVLSGVTDTIYITPQRESHVVSYEVNGVRNLSAAIASTAAVSGVAASRYVGLESTTRGVASDESATIGLDATINDTLQVTGSSEHFGCCSSGDGTHSLTLYYWTSSGTVSHTYDVTDQMHSAEDPTDIHLVINSDDELPADEDVEAFEAEVDEWVSDDDVFYL